MFAHERFARAAGGEPYFGRRYCQLPDALIGRLLYENVELRLFPTLPGEERPRVVLKVNLKCVKRSGGESGPKEFAFREDDMLLYDPLIPIMALVSRSVSRALQVGVPLISPFVQSSDIEFVLTSFALVKFESQMTCVLLRDIANSWPWNAETGQASPSTRHPAQP